MFRWLINKLLMRRVAEQLAKADMPQIPKAGRSSVEEGRNLYSMMNQYMGYFGGLSPHFPFEVLDFLVHLGMANPDINHAVTNLINLANSGHQVIIDSERDAVIQKAQERLNWLARNIYRRSAGVDGLINHYIQQIALTGALSSEDVVNVAMNGVEKIAIVPTRRIRFNWVDETYQPFQLLLSGDMVELNQSTYKYYAFRTLENSPYALPLFISAIQPILAQNDMQKNINFIIRKLGLLGLVAMTLTPPPKQASETPNEYSSRKSSYLTAVLNALQENFYKGLMVKFSDQSVEHHNITGEARGARDVWDLNEEQVASGMGIDPIILGRAFHSTETFANVTYMFMIRQANNIRRLAKRRMEDTYILDLQLQGIPADGLSFRFEPNPARDPQAESTAEMTRQNSIIKKAQVGVIDPDTAAQELGYDEWYDVDLLHGSPFSPYSTGAGMGSRRRVVFRFDRELGRYEVVRPNIPLIFPAAKSSPFKKGILRRSLASEKTVEAMVQEFADNYYDAIAPYVGKSTSEAIGVLEGWLRRAKITDFASEADFAEQAYNALAEVYVDAFKSQDAKRAIKDAVTEVYEYWRLEDTSAFAAGFSFDFVVSAADRRTMRFVRDVDRFYLSRYIYNQTTEVSLTNFLKEQYLEKGEGLFQRARTEVIDEFISLATDRLEQLTQYEASRIINTSVQRQRNWANVAQMNEAGFEYAVVYNPSPEAEICVYMNGQRIPVGPAYDAVQRQAAMSPEEFQRTLKPLTPEGMAVKGIEQATIDGEGTPPYHPNCKTRLVAE